MYDVIIIGARCAGAPVAMLLARRGYRVLLIDRSTFPSDHPMSTHLVWQPGMHRLETWGLANEVTQTACPPLMDLVCDLGPFALAGRVPPCGDVCAAYSPRRTILDAILVEAAVAAGAELREGCVVRDLLTEHTREGTTAQVRGIRAESRGGTTFTERAAIVIGADGTHSLVARVVDAPRYRERPPLQGTYWTYWSGVPVDGVQLHLRPYRCVYGWMTNDDLALVGVNWPAGEFAAVRRDAERLYLETLADVAPALSERIVHGRRADRFLGGSVPNFIRKPYGPGWALVGDAGYNKDPCTAQGISDAFRDADLLAEAVDDALSERRSWEAALADYERRRNEAVLAMYEFTCGLAMLQPPTPDMAKLFGALRSRPAETKRFLGVIAGTVPVEEFFAPANLEAIVSEPTGDL